MAYEHTHWNYVWHMNVPEIMPTQRTWSDSGQRPSHLKWVPLPQQAGAVVIMSAWDLDTCWFRSKKINKVGNYSQAREIMEATCWEAEDLAGLAVGSHCCRNTSLDQIPWQRKPASAPGGRSSPGPVGTHCWRHEELGTPCLWKLVGAKIEGVFFMVCKGYTIIENKAYKYLVLF